MAPSVFVATHVAPRFQVNDIHHAGARAGIAANQGDASGRFEGNAAVGYVSHRSLLEDPMKRPTFLTAERR